MITITLPFPDPRLNPNNSKGMHWAATSKLRKCARNDACILATVAVRKAGLDERVRLKIAGDIPLTITFVQPDRRARDRDNLLSAMKPSLDGVADALGVNDSQFEPVTVRREFGAKPGCVHIQIGCASTNEIQEAA